MGKSEALDQCQEGVCGEKRGGELEKQFIEERSLQPLTVQQGFGTAEMRHVH